MDNEAKLINSIRLRAFLELMTAAHGDAALEKFVEGLSPEARDVFHKLDDHGWLAAKDEDEIIRGLAGEFNAWDKLNAAGQECITGLLSNVLSSMPGHKTVRNYIGWLPSFVSFFNVGLFVEVEAAKDGRTTMVRFSARDKSPGSPVDVIFIQGLLEGLLNYIKVAFTEVRLRTVNTTIEDWPLPGTPAWVAFNQSTCIMEVKVGDLSLLITEVSRRSPKLDWSTSPRDAFMRQVISRASQLHHDKRELSTAVEYLHVANEELDKRLTENKKQRRMAANIQKGFIPAGIPDWEGLQFWVHFQPMEEVSGDLYDYFITNDGRLAYLVCDVSGHGVPAALISAIAKISFQNHRHQTEARPSDVFSNVNLDILNHVKMEGYLTAFYMIIDTNFTLTGSPHDDSLAGGSGDEVSTDKQGDSLSGGDGNDFINGHRGDDTITGGTGNDYLAGSREASVTVPGGMQDDAVFGTPGRDYNFNVTPFTTAFVDGNDADVCSWRNDQDIQLSGDEQNERIQNAQKSSSNFGIHFKSCLVCGSSIALLDGISLRLYRTGIQ